MLKGIYKDNEGERHYHYHQVGNICHDSEICRIKLSEYRIGKYPAGTDYHAERQVLHLQVLFVDKLVKNRGYQTYQSKHQD